jgi:hypothetical protein
MQVEVLQKPLPYCTLPAHPKELSEGMMEKKRCKEKVCPHLAYVKKIVRF